MRLEHCGCNTAVVTLRLEHCGFSPRQPPNKEFSTPGSAHIIETGIVMNEDTRMTKHFACELRELIRIQLPSRSQGRSISGLLLLRRSLKFVVTLKIARIVGYLYDNCYIVLFATKLFNETNNS